jgi:hypothetical protein
VLYNLVNIVGAIGVYFGMLIVVPKVAEKLNSKRK